jgi:hypothetical protein
MTVTIKRVLEPQQREGAFPRSGVPAPYFDLTSSLTVAEAIFQKGGGSCTPDQLANWLGYKSTSSGTFLTRVSAANRHFGFIDSNGDQYTVTERAKTILAPVMPQDSVNAKVEAFLAVPLFSKVYEKFRGTTLPPEVGLKNLLANTFNLVPDRIGPAVRVLLSSAEQAGMLVGSGEHMRLVKPSGMTGVVATSSPPVAAPSSAPATPQGPKFGGGSGDGGPPGVHSAILGLLGDLPPPGTTWTSAKKKRFLDAFKATVDFIYPEPEENP